MKRTRGGISLPVGRSKAGGSHGGPGGEAALTIPK